jgi:hypothetical protein
MLGINAEVPMKKLVLAFVMVAFGASAAYACDGMKGHEKADKGDQSAPSTAKKDQTKSGAPADQKS